MPVTGAKKVIKPEKFGGRTGIQFCIDGYLMTEVLKMIPDDVAIIGCNVMIGETRSSRKIPVPNALKKCGISWMRESVPSKECSLVTDTITKNGLVAKVRKVCALMGVPLDKAYFRYITIANQEASGKFQCTTKEIRPNEEDLRKKLRVLGLTDAKGRIQELLSHLGAKKYSCSIQEVVYRVAICSPA